MLHNLHYVNLKYFLRNREHVTELVKYVMVEFLPQYIRDI